MRNAAPRKVTMAESRCISFLLLLCHFVSLIQICKTVSNVTECASNSIVKIKRDNVKISGCSNIEISGTNEINPKYFDSQQWISSVNAPNNYMNITLSFMKFYDSGFDIICDFGDICEFRMNNIESNDENNYTSCYVYCYGNCRYKQCDNYGCYKGIGDVCNYVQLFIYFDCIRRFFYSIL